MCCFVLLIPTPEEYRVPRVNPGVTASKLFPPLLPSLATPGPPLPYRPLQKARYYYPRFRVGSSICLASSVGCAEGAGGIPISSWVVEMDLLLSRRLRLSNRGGGVRSRPGVARTILLFHTISVSPSKQPQIMEYVPSPKVFDV